ncbi:unnamed protein product [Allacma fusca]|uniref:PKS/mFAS DH domain-containing protein n=1 Tax=Allacma fusca TaxID=39272 RepID=A0A8J2JXT0_9HEXA|nr:unnamed protein product [Allacma fusca]
MDAVFLQERSVNQGLKFVINLSTDDFLTGHEIDKKIVFPATGYIYLVWKAFAKLHYNQYEETPVILENINFKRMTILPPYQDIEFIISVITDSGFFEIFENSEIVCTGIIHMANKEDQEMISNTPDEINVENVLDHEDFYKLLVLKGYDYQGMFRGVRNIETDGMWARLDWNDNWISFLDTMLQTYILREKLRLNNLVVPIRLDSATIFPGIFKKSLTNDSAIITRSENGFLIITTNNDIPNYLSLIAMRRTENGNVCLIKRKPSPDLKTVFVSLDMQDFGWVDILEKQCVCAKRENRIHMISRSSSSGIIGFTNCLMKELEWSHIRCVYIIDEANVYTEVEMEEHILKTDLVYNVYVNGSWGTYASIRVHKLENARNTEYAQVEIKNVGDLTSIGCVESPLKLKQRSDYEIHFSSLNFRDIMFATGKIPKNAFAYGHEECIGFEFSGTCRNKRVFGVADGNCLATALGFKPHMVWDVPDYWSLAEAVTVPAVYATVLYPFFMRAKLTKGESVLVHSGSGGVGIAAITIALDLECTVYTTVGSNNKREFLKTIFPTLLDEQIFDSNYGKTFKKEILKQTKGKGVDVILNSLAQDKLKASVECLGKRGRFLEIGKLSSINNTSKCRSSRNTLG